MIRTEKILASNEFSKIGSTNMTENQFEAHVSLLEKQ